MLFEIVDNYIKAGWCTAVSINLSYIIILSYTYVVKNFLSYQGKYVYMK